MARPMAWGGSHRMLPPVSAFVLLDEAVLGLRQAPHLVVGHCDVGAGDPFETDVCRVAIATCPNVDVHAASTDLVGEVRFAPEGKEVVILDTSEASQTDGRHPLDAVPRITGSFYPPARERPPGRPVA